MRPSRNSLSRGVAVLLASTALVASTALAFNVSGQRWPSGEIVMHLQLGQAETPLLDGAPSWNAVAEQALALWNSNLRNVRFSVVRDSNAPAGRNSGANNVFWSSTVYGDAWDANTLAITLSRYDPRTSRYSETDVLFNDTRPWNSYRGPLRQAGPGVNLNEFRRVALHEFGHVLGLNHPDDIGQRVDAIMNARSSAVDTLTADDIAGGKAIYDDPNAVPTPLLSLQGAVRYETLGSTLTIRAERVRNDGDAASGQLRLEVWAMPQPYQDGLPAGSVAMGIYSFPNPLGPVSEFNNVVAPTTYTEPAPGSYYVVMLLTEFTGASGSGYTIRDALSFPTPLNIGPATAPAISTHPAPVTTAAGTSATFSVIARGGLPRTYQWQKDGNPIAGATATTLTLSNVQPGDAGTYRVVVTNNLGTATSNPAPLNVTAPPNPADPGRLINMSIRTNAGTGDNTLIVGVALGGAGTSGTKAVLLRGIGPTLSAAFGLSDALADSVLTVFQGPAQIAQNDDWAGGFDFASVGAFGLSGSPPRDAALYNPALSSGSYSIQITGKNGATGVALAEIYDATPPASFNATTPRLVNVSARAHVGTGDNLLIAGFVVGGTSPVRVLIRAIGPTLGAAPFNVGGVLANPKLEIYSSPTTKAAENDDWAGTAALKAAFQSVGAFALSADNSRDAALVATLPPGNYTAQVTGVNSTTGVALVEVYELP